MVALDAADPLGFLAALGVLRVVARSDAEARLRWEHDGHWFGVLSMGNEGDLVELLYADVERWRAGHPAVDFALDADRKEQDLKHEPERFRELMRSLANNEEGAAFVAAYATGVVVDGSGRQTKPTSLHLTAGQQRFMAAILELRREVTCDDIREALYGPWVGRVGPSDTRWRAASERSRALLSFDPSKQKAATVVGAAWLAFQAMPFFPVVPVMDGYAVRARTTGFTGRGKREQFTWPVWSVPLSVDEVYALVGQAGLDELDSAERAARGIASVLRSDVLRSAQGYGNFSASRPV